MCFVCYSTSIVTVLELRPSPFIRSSSVTAWWRFGKFTWVIWMPCRTGKLLDSTTKEWSKIQASYPPSNVLKMHYAMYILPVKKRTHCEGRDTSPRERKL